MKLWYGKFWLQYNQLNESQLKFLFALFTIKVKYNLVLKGWVTITSKETESI